MANVVDNLVTNYILNDRYTPALRNIAIQTGTAIPSVTALTGGVAGLTGSLAAMGPAGAIALAAITGLVGALGGFAAVTLVSTGVTYKLGTAAIKQAAEMEILKSTLEALTGSAEEAAQGFKFLERFATQSVFEFQNLAEAGVQLTAFGLNMQRILPLISQIGAAFGAKPENLMQLTEAFGRIGAGQFGEALRQLRRFGIGQTLLQQEGIEFTKSGQAVATADQMFKAIEAIAIRRFGTVNDTLAKTLAVSISNLMDGVNQSLTVIGDKLMPIIKPLLDAVKEFASFMAGGGVRIIADSMANAFQAVVDLIGGRNGIINMLAWAVSIISVIPEIVANTANVLSAVLKQMSGIFGFLFDALRVINPGFAAISDSIRDRRNKILIDFMEFMDKPEGAGTADPGGFFTSENPPTDQYIKETAENTRVMAEELRLQRFALGGGQLAQRGLPAITRGQIGQGRAGVGGRSALEQLVNALVDQRTRRLR